MANSFGKTSRLALTAARRREKTVLADVSFTAPFTIMHPFPGPGDAITVMAQTASAGIMAGDCQEHTITLEDGARLVYTSQAYEKIHKMAGGSASRHIAIRQGPDTFLDYQPLPTIPFKDSAFTNTVDVDLAGPSSQFVMREVLCCGRAARGERFAYRYYRNRITVTRGDCLIYRDNTRFDPLRMDMEGYGLYEGYSHQGNLLLFGLPRTNDDWLAQARDLIDGWTDVTGGATRTAYGDVVIRVLGNQGQTLDALFDAILAI